MMRNQKKRIKRLLSLALCMITVLSLLVGTAPWNSVFVVRAAVAPTLSITSGTPYFYSISGSNPASVTYGTATSATSVMSASMSGNVVTIKENSASKLFELGYVPIVTSMTVPAETAYQVTLTFTASGVKSASGGTAVAFLEIYDFGSSDDSSSLTFNMSDNATYSHATYTKLRAKEDTKNTNFGGTYTVTVDFTNTSASEQTISHYFGFFTGVHYGSKYDHTLTSTCTITAGKIVDRDDIVPTVNASTSNLWHLIDGASSAANDTQASSRFVQEKDSITTADAELMNLPGDSLFEYNDYWERFRASLTIGTNKLTIKNRGCTTLSCHMSYAPFSVPITVPAHMTRTYYLTFTIDYERNTGSGAGFFAELIQGGVPQSFNTAASATMTGNTKLRVYSTGGDAHSGSVTIPITLTNNTDSAQIHSEDFVFFAGHRRVGVYQPEPIFNLTLTDISYASYESDYDVMVNATNCSYTAPAKVGTGQDCSVTFTPNTGYSLPSTVTVQIGSSTLSVSSYTYSSSTGKLTIPAKYIKDAVTVTAAGVPNTYTITYSGLENATLTTKPTTHTYGTATTVGNPTKTGYTFAGWKVNSSSTATKSLTLGATSYTANITLTATWTVNTYTITYNKDGGTIANESSYTSYTYGTGLTLPTPARTGYAFGGWYTSSGLTGTAVTSISGTATGNKTYYAKWTAKEYTITYSGLENATLTTKPTTHTYGTATTVGNPTKTGYVFSGWKINSGTTAYKDLSLGATDYTGNITLTATWTKATYNATLSGSNVTASSGFGTGTVTYQTAWTGKFTANSGYVLPDSISVTVGGSTLSSTKYTYTKSTGTVTIAADYVTGNIVVTANGHKHSYTGAVTTPATCTTNGVRTYTCSCGDSYTEPIPATGHHYGTPTWSWTGVTSAKATFTCQNDSSHKEIVTATITNKVTTNATCTASGIRTYTATVTFNGVTYTNNKTEVIPATGHNWSTAWYYDIVQHWHICTNEGTTVTDTKTDHSFIWVVDREPTVSTDGLRHEECTVCGYAKPQETYTVDIVSVEITWGAMEFTYSEGTWNPETHSYEGEGWMPDETDGNRITVTNTGNVEVNVSYGYTRTNTAVSGSFTDGQAPITAPVALPVGDTKDAWLILNGKPTETLGKAVLGSVTVTVGGD